MAILAGFAGVCVFIFALALFLIIGWGWNALFWAWVSGFVTIIIFLILGRNAPRYFDDDEEYLTTKGTKKHEDEKRKSLN